MASFLGRSSCVSRSARDRRVRLAVDRLEGRDCPAAPDLSVGYGILPNHVVHFEGQVYDESPGSVLIQFSGAVTGSTSTNSCGYFTFEGVASSLGMIEVVAFDNENLESNHFVDVLTNDVPMVDFTAVEGPNKTVSIDGYVIDDDPAFLTVVFSGKVSTTADTNSLGYFTKTVTASGLGEITATTIDDWDQLSGPTVVTLESMVPEIENFWGSEGPGAIWSFTGHVRDEYAAGLTVTLGGIPSLAGKTVVTNQSGDFTTAVQLRPNEFGMATATVKDQWGQVSLVAQFWVVQTP